jgi:hypothetical protein
MIFDVFTGSAALVLPASAPAMVPAAITEVFRMKSLRVNFSFFIGLLLLDWNCFCMSYSKTTNFVCHCERSEAISNPAIALMHLTWKIAMALRASQWRFV